MVDATETTTAIASQPASIEGKSGKGAKGKGKGREPGSTSQRQADRQAGELVYNLHRLLSALDASSRRCRVVPRVRPILPREMDMFDGAGLALWRGDVPTELVHAMDAGLDVGHGARRFGFDDVLWENVAQAECFRRVAQRPLRSAIRAGHDATFVCYGRTGDGKSYTMLGRGLLDQKEERGLLPRAIDEIFDVVEREGGGSVELGLLDHVDCRRFSDLLQRAAGGREADLRVSQKSTEGPFVEGQLWKVARSAEDCLKLLQDGLKMRAIVNTMMGGGQPLVSNSTLICTIRVTLEACGQKLPRSATLMFLDLAGSEKSARVGRPDLRPAPRAIAMMALQECVRALASPTAFAPFRNSPLTRLLQASLIGERRTSAGELRLVFLTIVPNLSSSAHGAEETLQTLRFAALAAQLDGALEQRDVRSKGSGRAVPGQLRSSGWKRDLWTELQERFTEFAATRTNGIEE